MCIRWPELDGLVFPASPVFLCLSWEVIYTCKDYKFNFKWLLLGLYWSHNALIICCSLYNPCLQFGTATGNCLSWVFNWWKNASTFASETIRSKFTLNLQIKEIFLMVTAVPLSPLSPRPLLVRTAHSLRFFSDFSLSRIPSKERLSKEECHRFSVVLCWAIRSSCVLLPVLGTPSTKMERVSWWHKSVHSPC